MTNPTTPTFAVIGATGQQGGAVANALLDRSHGVRALTRDVTSTRSRELTARGADVVHADIDDPASLRAGLEGTDGIFAMTTFATSRGTEGEVVHGRAIADAAAAVGTSRIVYSSVGGAERETGIPHFESKRRVEEYLAELELPATIIRPVFFMDNFGAFISPSVENGVSVLRAPLTPGVPLQMIAVSDIGGIVARALTDPDSIEGGEIEIAADELTPEEMAEQLGRRAGLPGVFSSLPTDVVPDEDQQAMFAWFARYPAYQADIEATRRLQPGLLDFTSFLARRGDQSGR